MDKRREGRRAVSTTLGYTLTLVISTLLVTGLIIAGSNFVSTQRETVIRNELEVVGEQVAGQLEQADRLVSASSDPNLPLLPASYTQEVRINRSIPERAAGENYDIHLEPGSPAELELTTRSPDVTVTVSVGLQNDIGSSDATGGTVMVRCENCPSGSPRLVIDDA